MWGSNEQNAFSQIKLALTSAPVLACPDFEFVLQTNTRQEGVGAVLTQNLGQGERVIAYAIRTLETAERNSATELECLAVWGIRRMHCYLEGYHFTVLIDHQALNWLQQLDTSTDQLGRWLFELQQFDFDIQYRQGNQNQVADALSGKPMIGAITTCPWYTCTIDQVKKQPETMPNYTLRGDKLYRHELDFQDTPSEEQWKECVSQEKRKWVLHRFHDVSLVDHLGVTKTTARIAARLYY